MTEVSEVEVEGAEVTEATNLENGATKPTKETEKTIILKTFLLRVLRFLRCSVFEIRCLRQPLRLRLRWLIAAVVWFVANRAATASRCRPMERAGHLLRKDAEPAEARSFRSRLRRQSSCASD
jgi:hypothetical protein